MDITNARAALSVLAERLRADDGSGEVAGAIGAAVAGAALAGAYVAQDWDGTGGAAYNQVNDSVSGVDGAAAPPAEPAP